MSVEERLKVMAAYSELENMRYTAAVGLKILRKLYPWLKDVVDYVDEASSVISLSNLPKTDGQGGP